MSKIATEQEAYNIGGSGSPVDKKMCTKARAIALGCTVNGSYANNQLVQLADLESSKYKPLTFVYLDGKSIPSNTNYKMFNTRLLKDCEVSKQGIENFYDNRLRTGSATSYFGTVYDKSKDWYIEEDDAVIALFLSALTESEPNNRRPGVILTFQLSNGKKIKLLGTGKLQGGGSGVIKFNEGSGKGLSMGYFDVAILIGIITEGSQRKLVASKSRLYNPKLESYFWSIDIPDGVKLTNLITFGGYDKLDSYVGYINSSLNNSENYISNTLGLYGKKGQDILFIADLTNLNSASTVEVHQIENKGLESSIIIGEVRPDSLFKFRGWNLYKLNGAISGHEGSSYPDAILQVSSGSAVLQINQKLYDGEYHDFQFVRNGLTLNVKVKLMPNS